MGGSPYSNLPPERFWRTGVAGQQPETIEGLYRKRFEISPDMRIATAGSCFAQHIARHMRQHGFDVLDLEPAPPGLPKDLQPTYGYGLYSARYGNIYLVRQLRQLLDEAYGRHTPSDAVWERDGRCFDALRPSVEPDGLGSRAEVLAHRERHLAAVRSMVEAMDLFVFTFGLTEGWVHSESGTVYPGAPGTIAGDYDPAVHRFHNFTFAEILADFQAARAILRELNPQLRFLVTVSPVPLTATATGNHVLSASVYSKSVLRAVAGQLYDECGDLDYFPSYEMVASHFSSGAFFASNRRSVTADGVSAVMRVFFDEHATAVPDSGRPGVVASTPAPMPADDAVPDEVCEEALLDAFAP